MQKIETKEFLKRYWWILKKDKVSWDNLMICCPFHNEQNPSFWLVKMLIMIENLFIVNGDVLLAMLND